MSLQVDPLQNYYSDDGSSAPVDEADPLASYYEESKPSGYRDVVSEELREHGVEPDISDELERASEFGRAEATRGAIKGATLGFSDFVPGLKPEKNIASQTGELIGSSLPISRLSKMFNKPLTSLASKSPVLQKQLSSLANLMGIRHADMLAGSFLSGGTYGAITGATNKKEMPSVDDFVEHGATWALLDGALQTAGGTGRFAKALFTKAKKIKKPEWKVVNDTINELREEGVDFSNSERVQAKALSLLEESAPEAIKESPKSSPLRDKKVEQKFFDRLEGESIPEPYFPKQFEAMEIIDNVGNEQIAQSLEALSPRAQTQKQLGENIKASIDAGMKEAEGVYTPAYKLAEEAASLKSTVPVNTAKIATDTLKSIEGFKTNPEGYAQVRKTLQNALEDAGFVINRDDKGIIEFSTSQEEVFADKLMELGRRLNKIIKYDSIDKQVQDKLKPVVQAVKQDIKVALKDTPGAVEMFENAERDFGKSARKFGRDSIRKIRTLEEGEKVAKLARNPSTLADLKEIMPPERFKEVERELLENVRSLSEERARAFYREIRPSLSADAQAIGEEILDSKIPRGQPSRREALRAKTNEVILNDLSKSSLTGERPDAALKLWKTKEGQQLIKDAVKDNPNGKEIIDYLSNQSLKDMTSSIISSEGKVNLKKLNDFLRDPATRGNLKLLGGQEGVDFLSQLETLAKRAQKNLSIMEARIGKGGAKDRKELEQALESKGKERFRKAREKVEQKTKDTLLYKIDDFFASYGIKAKAVLALLGVAKFGIPGVLEGATAFEVLKRLLKNKSLQRAVKQASGPRTDPKHLVNAYEAINRSVQD